MHTYTVAAENYATIVLTRIMEHGAGGGGGGGKQPWSIISLHHLSSLY